MLFVAKNLERIGDQATNLADNLLYIVKGEAILPDRAKAADLSYLSVKPPT